MIERLRKIDPAYVIIPFTVFVVIWVIAAFTGQWAWNANGYNSYTLQACSWLNGRLDLGQDYPWLELAIYNGKYFVSFPPFPSFVLLPFAMIFGANTPDHFIALAVTLLGAVYAVKLYRTIRKSSQHLEFFVLFLYLASGMLFLSMNGYVWFIAQSMSFTLSLMALTYAFKGKGGFALAFWACAVGCRPMVAIYFPFLIYVLWKTWKKSNPEGKWLDLLKQKWTWCIATGLIALSYMILNFMRFGNITEFGHNYLPEFTRTTTGQFNLSYLMTNLKSLVRLPETGGTNGALKFYTAEGMAFWLITPLFITMLIAWIYGIMKKREHLVLLIMLPVLVALHVLFICCHKTLGGWHFGNRYLMDTLPYLFAGMLLWMPKKEWFARWNIPLFFLGLAVNVVGTVATYNSWI